MADENILGLYCSYFGIGNHSNLKLELKNDFNFDIPYTMAFLSWNIGFPMLKLHVAYSNEITCNTRI